MVEKISKRVIQSVHAAVDELAAASPETFTALSTILSNLMSSTAAIAVPPRKGTKATTAKPTKGKAVDPDDLEDEEEDDADDDGELDTEEDEEDGELDTDEDDELDDAPKGGKGKAAPAKAKPAKGKSKPVVEEPEEEEDADEDDNSSDDEGLDLDDLEADTIKEGFENFQPGETHDKANGGIRELTAAIDGFGFDSAAILKVRKGKPPLTPAQKKEKLAAFASRIYATIDAINEFDLDSIVEALGEYYEDGYKTKGRSAAAKEYQAATDLFVAAVIGLEEGEE